MRENVKNKFNKTTGIFKPQFSCGLFNFGQPSKISFRKYLTQEKNVITLINSLTRIRPRTRAPSSTQLPTLCSLNRRISDLTNLIRNIHQHDTVSVPKRSRFTRQTMIHYVQMLLSCLYSLA